MNLFYFKKTTNNFNVNQQEEVKSIKKPTMKN